MKRKLSGVAIIIIIVVLIGLLMMRTYNSLVTIDENVKQQFSQIQTMIQRRADLIPNYVETVKGYATHESEVLTEVTKARAGVNEALSNATEENPNTEAIAEANGKLNIALNAVVEAYPELKANENFMALQDELAGAENRIAKARKDYNESVGVYNKKIRTFPTSIMASIFGFDKHDYFEASSEAQDVPKVDF
ncbi:MAG: LemA family protein [Tissierellia bacterium]|nr:LemA family protein [Tissierellia bacterium]